ncbi:metal-dependent hydrolase [Streptomyces sp. RFCAC02]|uniref:metal-dependent hydrolase n=1 Tax=Streptomyces sp. RFCAC02 TaxID=2499143 RepID=UPI001020E0DD|nr:metal-dependent hydrolase [Streptomyces sp. RFCAC02]
MSWAAHELESYLLHKHIKAPVSFLAILTGSLAPDMLTKLPVYGIRLGSLVIAPDRPWDYHRGWPGAGPTHSLMFGVVLGVLVLWLFRSRTWALGLFAGTTAHVLTDVFDSVGTMVFFPFTTQHYSAGMWAYAAQAGRYGDAAAYYGSLGLAWDLFWLALALLGFRVLRARYFFTEVVPSDPAWGWLRRRLHLSDRVLLACYRAYFVYGACRIVAWTLWARLVEGAPMDWSWGGPYWVDKVTLDPVAPTTLLAHTAVGATGLAVTLWLLWVLLVRRLWRAAGPAETGGTPVMGRQDAIVSGGWESRGSTETSGSPVPVADQSSSSGRGSA